MISLTSHGSFKETLDFLDYMKGGDVWSRFDHYGRMGVDALSRASPRDTGLMASSWIYEVNHRKGYHSIEWGNTNIEGGLNIAVIVQYGHGVKGGGYVAGRDYINPAMRPFFDQMVDDIWRQITNG